MRRRHPFSSFWLLFVEFLDGFAKSFASSASKLMALETKFIAMFTLNRRTYANCYGLKQSWNLVLAPELLFSRTVRIKKQTLRRSKTTARKHDFYSILALVSLLGLGITQSARANLITNGGFETGDFSGWTVFGIDNDVVGANPFTSPHSGNFQALFGSGSNFITQNVTTTPGSSYVISFWLAASVPQGGSPFVSVNWSGSTIFSDSLTSPFGYTEYTFAVNALSPATQLQTTQSGLSAVSVRPRRLIADRRFEFDKRSQLHPNAQRNAFPSSQCASAIQIVRPCESTAETQPTVQPALLSLFARCSQYFIRVQVDDESPRIIPQMQ